MKESKSEKASSEEKNSASIFNSAKKALKNLDPAIENLDDLKNHSNDSNSNDSAELDHSSKSENESKKSFIENSLPNKDIKSSKTPKNQNEPTDSLNSPDSEEFNNAKESNSSFSGIITKFTQFKTSIQEDRHKLFVLIGLLVAAIFILLGISFLFGTSDKVSDNVVFGERSVTSAFLVIIGLLIIAGIYAPKIIGKTSFDSIYQEMRGVENDPSKKDETDPKEDDLKNNHLSIESPKESENENPINENPPEKEDLPDEIPEKEK